MKRLNLIVIVFSVGLQLFSNESVMWDEKFNAQNQSDVFMKEYKETLKIPFDRIEAYIVPVAEKIINKNKDDFDKLWGDSDIGLRAILESSWEIKDESGKKIQIENQYIAPVLTCLFTSDVFKNSTKTFKQKSFDNMLDLMRQVPLSRQTILSIIFRYFVDIQEYESLNGKKIIWFYDNPKECGNYPIKYILLTAFVTENGYNLKNVISNAEKCEKFDNKKLENFLSLIICAKVIGGNHLDKLIKMTNDMKNYQEATFMFPYLTLVRRKEIVEILKKKLENDKIVDQGEDIINRYTGLSVVAAYSLYTLIDGFYKFDRYNFNESERQKCLEWFKQNPDYKFRPMNYKVDDSIIKRMHYMIFEYK